MNVTVKAPPQRGQAKFPTVRKSDVTGAVVLFTSPTDGVYLHMPADPMYVGTCVNNLDSDQPRWVPCSITLDSTEE